MPVESTAVHDAALLRQFVYIDAAYAFQFFPGVYPTAREQTLYERFLFLYKVESRLYSVVLQLFDTASPDAPYFFGRQYAKGSLALLRADYACSPVGRIMFGKPCGRFGQRVGFCGAAAYGYASPCVMAFLTWLM